MWMNVHNLYFDVSCIHDYCISADNISPFPCITSNTVCCLLFVLFLKEGGGGGRGGKGLKKEGSG